mgnify:CR=1 FL=1
MMLFNIKSSSLYLSLVSERNNSDFENLIYRIDQNDQEVNFCDLIGCVFLAVENNKYIVNQSCFADTLKLIGFFKSYSQTLSKVFHVYL